MRVLQDDGTIGVYGHISETLVSVWQRVLAGAQIQR
jgi:murein DD-endopeptidase MepM/ murein hydrolase activator NlpD